MFIVLLTFTGKRSPSADLTEGHKAWIKRGFDEGVFLATGPLGDKSGGGVLAQGASLTDLETRVKEDPFVAEQVVSPEIFELCPSQTDSRLAFLLAQDASV